MKRYRSSLLFLLAVVLTGFGSARTEDRPPKVQLPLEQGSVRFAVIGDTGTGEAPEYRVAAQMERYRKLIDYKFVIMLGDNIYGGDKPKDFAVKFEHPYADLLSAGVVFYATLGNHDNPTVERAYQPFHMADSRYYTFTRGGVQFFALDSNYMDPAQLAWLEQQLSESRARWKVCFFHHPLFNSGKMHGPDLDLRSHLMPLFVKYKVNVVFSGHEHMYERLKPQQGIHFFICGNSGKLEKHDLRPSPEEDAAIDTQRDFILVEIRPDVLNYETVSENGEPLDGGSFPRESTPSQH